jgi:hypothetical protein
MGASNKQLRDEVALLRVEVGDLREKGRASAALAKQIFSYMGDVETRLEAFRVLCIRAGTFTNEELDSTWDQIKGLRVRGPSEVIQQGDYLRITYKACDKKDNQILLAEKEMPLVVGYDHLKIEEYLIGKKVDTKDLKFDIDYPKDYPSNPRLSGKTLAFNVTIDKVKVKCLKRTDQRLS